MSRYLKPRDHGYLMEAAACVKVLGDLQRIEAKFARAVERESAARQAEFEKVMQYHSKRELQDDFGWGFITEAQYDRYRLLFQQGQAAMEQLPPTKSELALRLVRRIMADIALPGTGAWTGTLAASILDMDFKSTVAAVMLGVLLAGMIMMIVSLAGVTIFL